MARRFVLKPDDLPARHAFTIDYSGELNPQQYAAATAPGGAVLVIAGAGTGKTRTLVYRVAYLVETGTPPEEIVLLTFTRRAAQEMLTRAATLLDGRCQRVAGGTFHAFCVGILRRHAPRLGFPSNFTILDAADAADVVDVLRAATGLHRSGKRFPKKATLYNMFSAAANRGLSLEEILETKYPQFLDYLEPIRELQAGFAQYKRQYGLMDYDDLLAHTLDLFDRDAAAHRQVAAACRHVLVDEYQDTNPLQAALVERFAAVHGNVMAVGDDAQSIYRFRGADFRNIFSFPERFAGTQLLKLEQNYRSTQSILDLANHVIRQAGRKYDKHLFSERAEGERPAVVPAPDDRFESRFVRQMVLQLREEGVPLNRMAVLFRSSYNAYDLEVELGRHKIPYVKYGGIKLAEAAHIKDVTAYLRVADNPKDAVSWNRILQLLEGVGPKTANDLIEWITSAADDPFVLQDRPYSPRYVEELKRLFEMLRALRKPEAPLVAQLETVVRYYEPILKRQYYEDYPDRLASLERFVALSASHPDRTAFLAAVTLDPIELHAVDTEPLDEDEAPLVLSTIHSAKGLEFHTVFLIHALDGVLPSAYALRDPDALDEELRLLYVAVTRAEENLFISYPVVQYQRFSGEYLSNPSRFIDGVPEHLLEPVQLVEERPPALPPRPAPAALPEAPDAPKVPDPRKTPEAERPRGKRRLREKRPETHPSTDGDDGLPF